MAALLSHGDKQGFQSVTLAEIYLGEFTGAFLDEKKTKQFHHKVDEHRAALPEEMFYFSFFTSQHVQPEVNKSWIKFRIRSCDLAVDDASNS